MYRIKCCRSSDCSGSCCKGANRRGPALAHLPEVDEVALPAADEVGVEHHVAVASVELTVLFLEIASQYITVHHEHHIKMSQNPNTYW